MPTHDRPLVNNQMGIEDLPNLGLSTELRCLPCGRVATYPIGRLFLDPSAAQSQDPQAINASFGFSGYFHCRFCGAGGPWSLTVPSAALVVNLLMELIVSPKHGRIHICKLVLFDGTVSRWPTQGEAHLKQLVEKEPENYFLYNRLGNLYKGGDACDLAIEAFTEAVKRNEHDVAAMHSMAEIYLELKHPETAAMWYHRVLQHARYAPVAVPEHLLRDIVYDSLKTLTDIYYQSGKKIPLLPTPLALPPADADLLDAQIRGIDITRPDGREVMVDLFVGDRAPRPAPAVPYPTRSPRSPELTGPPLHPRRAEPARVGRNDPCPCGSGRKFKACCLRKRGG